jgi:hypothetical protein
MHYAVNDGVQLEILQMLLDAGYAVDAVCEDGVTPLMLLLEKDTMDISKRKRTAIRAAIDLLIQAGADVNHRQSCGCYALAQCSSAHAMERMLRAGALVDQSSHNGGNQLHELIVNHKDKAVVLELARRLPRLLFTKNVNDKRPHETAEEEGRPYAGELHALYRAAKRCSHCGSSRTKRCAGCRAVSYCNESCQKAHRSQHAKDCVMTNNLPR